MRLRMHWHTRASMETGTKEDTLLKLRKVEITGFKSFFERTTVTFSGSGTTCIVGPNGCGKSNVVDAISWVLGEQSHKSLRAGRMSDCIFNGTLKRPPLGLAEVTITMEDPELAEAARFVLEATDIIETSPEGSAQLPTVADGLNGDSAASVAELTAGEPGVEILSLDPAANTEAAAAPESEAAAEAEFVPDLIKGKRRKRGSDKLSVATKPGEVVVSRRLYRSGQSEYLINGRTARLRDIQDMFMGVGLGPDSYAIIEQGRIGQILSTKPMERRAIIEEAAGVTKFKTKKRLAEAKLESSKINLARVNDIVVEVEKQLGSLKRQAAKARRYSEVRDQMRAIVRQMLAGKARELDAEAERVATSLAELTAAETEQAAGILAQETEHDRVNRRIYELDAELKQNQNVLNLTALEADRSENRVSFNRQRAEELAGRRGQISAEMAQAIAQAAECAARNAAQLEAVAAVREESGALQLRVDELTARAQSRSTQIADSEMRITALRQTASQASESLLRLHGEQKQAEEALVHQAAALHKLEISEHDMLESSIRIRDDADHAAYDFETASGELNALKENAATLQAQLADARISAN